MMSVPCPKCGADSDDVGSKYVCGQCYWVFDKGSTMGAAPMRPSAEMPTPQRPAAPPQAPRPAMQLSAPGPAPGPAPAAAGAPTVCPKCSGNLINMSGKFVCEKCFHSVDPAEAAAARPGAQPSAAPVAPAAQSPGPSHAPPTPALTQAPPSIPTPSAAAAPVCPKCSGNLVTIGGKSVCEKCFHTVDGPDAPPAPQAPLPSNRPAAVAPLVSAAASPAMSLSTSTGGQVCPKCSGTLMDISGKMVCEQCYHVVDAPGFAPATKPALPFAQPAAAAVFTPPTACPKCSSKLMDVGGKYVCEACYHVVDTPGSTPAPARGNFTPRTTESTPEGEMSPQMIGGIALILLLVLMIAVLAIRH
ncbi:MAG: hypothetical protein JST89_01565 [Cyanobacteria bacterium SZAS-4]|nr:hypothetical protein [Cyanobacteria bacterium SZAS-4]